MTTAANAHADRKTLGHPYNTVVRFSPAEPREIVADASNGAEGGSGLAVVVDQSGGGVLCLVSDGGAFGGVPDARGRLVQIALSGS